ncbi:MAG TPA: helix-turn-helix transcriptional regulator [Candidatus Binataceae bacterium]|nr:helix-turn-helix transcriptional regulator [Candidatus Binataceae bacterium]
MRQDIEMIGGERFARTIRDRRRQLDLTQQDVARRIGTSVAYIAHLEADRRHASEKVIVGLAEVLGLDPRELFFLANPETRDLVSPTTSSKASAWDAFSADQKLRKVHGITGSEMETLSQIALMGEVRSSRDFIFILNTIRHALGK